MDGVILGLSALIALFLIGALTVWYVWDETGDMVEEVDEEWQPIETLREITPAQL